MVQPVFDPFYEPLSRDDDVRYVEDARQLGPATAPPRSETSRSSRNSSKNREV